MEKFAQKAFRSLLSPFAVKHKPAKGLSLGFIFMSGSLFFGLIPTAAAEGSIAWRRVKERVSQGDRELVQLIEAHYEIDSSGSALRLGNHFGDRAGERIPPYSFHATSRVTGERFHLEIDNCDASPAPDRYRFVARSTDQFASASGPLTLPGSIHHQILEDRQHVYEIRGLYSLPADVPAHEPRLYRFYFPSFFSLEVDRPEGSLRIFTKAELPPAQLASSLNQAAQMSAGDIPFWGELIARDLPRSPVAGEVHFNVAEYPDEFPQDLSWHTVQPPSRQQLSLRYPQLGSVLINPTRAHCMAHACFAIRILDSQNRVIWKDSKTAYASILITVYDCDNDGIQEICLRRDDHGQQKQFVIKKTQ